MARAVCKALVDDPTLSARQLSIACGVSPPTFRHYFGSRAGALRAAIEVAADDCTAAVRATTSEELGPAAIAVRTLLARVVEGWTSQKLGALHRLGIHNACVEPGVGSHFAQLIIEPFVGAFEERVALHAARGELEIGDTRCAALMLISPIVLALLHQTHLGGDEFRPIDFDELIDELSARFIRAYRPKPASSRRPVEATRPASAPEQARPSA